MTSSSETPDFQTGSTLSHHAHGHADAMDDEESLTPLEQEVLDEYARLLGNLNQVRPLHSTFLYSSSTPLPYPSLPFPPLSSITQFFGRNPFSVETPAQSPKSTGVPDVL